MKNKDLKPIYDSQKLNFHSGFNESQMIVGMLDSWQGLDVLEIGCGHGHLASILSYAGANVTAYDNSDEQINQARIRYNLPDLYFIPGDILNIYEEVGKFDIVVMQGVLEHLDEPWQELDKIMENLLKPSGCVCLSVPHWVNPRGYIYHALRLLFDAKMSLTDLHYFLPGDFKKYCSRDTIPNVGTYQCQFYTCDKSWASGEEMIEDFRERLPKALRPEDWHEANVPQVNEKIDTFLKFLEKMSREIEGVQGACLGVKISK